MAPLQHRLLTIERTPPWLTVSLPSPQRVLSWSVNRPGFVSADRIVWREVRNADLPVDLAVEPWLAAELQRAGYANAPCMITSRPLRHVQSARTVVDAAAVEVVATVGLSNAERIGERRAPLSFPAGTINLAVVVSPSLSDAAFLETMSIATEARTAAVLEHGPQLETGAATGTGTDCVAVAARTGATRYAGLHTALGEAVGRAVYDAVSAGVQQWIRTRQAS